MKLKTFFLGVFVSTLIFSTSFSNAEPTKKQPHQNKAKTHFIIGVEDLQYYPLWSYNESQNEYTGFARKMLDAFAESAGYTFEYRPYPIKRLVRTLVNTKIDFKFPDNPYWAQDVKGDAPIIYSEPTIEYIDGVFVRPDHTGKGNESIKTLGSVLGFTPWDWLGKIESGDVTLREMPGFDSLLNQAIKGRIDGAYVNMAIARYRLKTDGRENGLVFDEGLSHTKSNYLLSTIKHPKIVEEFNHWMKDNHDTLEAMKVELGVVEPTPNSALTSEPDLEIQGEN